MKTVIKSIILAGGYKLADMQHKTKKLYVMGDLEEQRMDELLALAAGGVCADAERPEILAILKSLSDRSVHWKQTSIPGMPEKVAEKRPKNMKPGTPGIASATSIRLAPLCITPLQISYDSPSLPVSMSGSPALQENISGGNTRYNGHEKMVRRIA